MHQVIRCGGRFPRLASDPGASLNASDWLVRAAPIMNDLAPSSGEWWMKVVKAAHASYDAWQKAAPLQKAMIACVVPSELRDVKFSRLESRATSMMLSVFPNI